MSQDHLETFFGCVRGKGGYNNNPTACQFRAAYKRLLFHTEVTSSDAANCCRDVVSILNMSSAVSLAESPTAVTSHRRSSLLEPVDDEHDYTHRVDLPQSLSVVTSAVVPYIAGFVARKKARLQAYGAQRRHKAVAASFCPEQYGRRRVSAASLRYMGGYAGPPLQKF
ncbi:hypothetical protein HPB51_019444 [Rhipicephalus microplus]|uniref:Transposable element P transposase-like RNase H C-terminal domain-containing protein n=1 Tax=Rhipicephalus microplus TaxID=6941 RepID=A0A9J6DP45_RHIMP|nr:hypothetical protein HPB51_019444 [Rhipicephalus microplus]